MSFINSSARSPAIRPAFNVGCLVDFQTGAFFKGAKGETLTCGGVRHVTHIAGPGNVGKSQLAMFFMGRIQSRYGVDGMFKDTELTASINRVNKMYRLSAPKIYEIGLENYDKFIFSDKAVESCSAWAEKLKKYADEQDKKGKFTYLTPFLDRGEPIYIRQPTAILLDSLSEFKSDSVIEMHDKHNIGDGGLNTEAFKDNHSKTQMLSEWVTSTVKGGFYIITTIHIGKEHVMDTRNPPRKMLKFLKQGTKFKNAPEKATFLSNDIWYILTDDVLLNDTTKAPQFPRNKFENERKGSTDLKLLTVGNLRGKSGPSGEPFPLVVSQSEGILEGLTHWVYLKQNRDFGIIDPTRTSWSLDLYPEKNFARTTIRTAIEEDPKLARALEITTDLCQLRNYFMDLPPGYACTPAELYADIKALGYDWDVLLKTRNYWTQDQYTNPIPYLHIMDLLDMRAGVYKPYWLE